MPLLDALSLSCSLAEIESIWTLHLADAFARVPILAWRIRWIFPDNASTSVDITWGEESAVYEFLDQPDALRKVATVKHPHIPASIYAAGRDHELIKEALDTFSRAKAVNYALANSFHVLRAHFAAQTTHALFQSELPVILIAPDGHVYRHTPLAFLMLNGDKSQLGLADKKLVFRSFDHEATYKTAIAQAFAKPRVPHKIRCAGFSMTFTAAATTSHHPMATVVLRNLDLAPKVDVRELQGEFNLTLSQARLAKALIGGETLQDYANRNRLTPKGVKWHLHPLMKKLDCASRDQLMLKLVRWAG